jgi:hypothetical protein
LEKVIKREQEDQNSNVRTAFELNISKKQAGDDIRYPRTKRSNNRSFLSTNTGKNKVESRNVKR